MNIKLLRKELPEWYWNAVRLRGRWRYEGFNTSDALRVNFDRARQSWYVESPFAPYPVEYSEFVLQIESTR